ncbi:glyoxalase superfamily protein [Agrobacterium sp. CG674]
MSDLGQPFIGEIIALSSSGTYYSMTVRFDEPVDTVTFDSFSNMRSVVRSVVYLDGNSVRKTSNGTLHLVLSAI